MLRVNPGKINPDHIHDGRLSQLNNLRGYLLAGLRNPLLPALKSQRFSDALKVVDGLRFIKVNEPFLRYAFTADKHDSSVYSRTADGQEYVVRDFNGVALDLFIYQDKSQYPDQERALEECIKDHLDAVKHFEDAFEFVMKAGKLNEFIDSLQFDEKTGCLAKRIAPGLKYAEKLKQGLFIFEDLMQGFITAADQAEDSDEEFFKKALKYFNDYLFKKALYADEQGTREITITPEFIEDYLVTVLFRQDPRPKKETQARLRPVEGAPDAARSNVAPAPAPKSPAQPQSYLTITSEEALQCIKEENALARNISAPVSQNRQVPGLDVEIGLLADPENTRPIKGLYSGSVDRNTYWDPTDGQYHQRQVAPVRGGAKPGRKHTKKMSTTLMPRNGKIYLCEFTDPVFFIYKLAGCDLKVSKNTGKPKYVWKENANTNSKSWVGDYGPYKQRSITLEELRAHLRSFEETGRAPRHNEILACLAKEVLQAVGTQNDALFDRLNALRVRESLRGTLGVHLPILISPVVQGPRVYTRAMQMADIEMAMNYPSYTKEARVLQFLPKPPAALLALYRQQDQALQTLVDVARRSETEALELLAKHEEFFAVAEEAQEVKIQTLRAALQNKQMKLASRLLALNVNLHHSESVQKNKKLFWLVLESGDADLIDQALKLPLGSQTIAQAILLAARDNQAELLVKLFQLKPLPDLQAWRFGEKTAFDFIRERNNPAVLAALQAAGVNLPPEEKVDPRQTRLLQTLTAVRLQIIGEPEQMLQTSRAVLLKIIGELEQVMKTEAEKKALQTALEYLQVMAGQLQPEGGSSWKPDQIGVDDVREYLIKLLDAENPQTGSEDFYAGIHTSLLALCHWWPQNKTQFVLGLLPSSGKPLTDENCVLTSSGLQMDKEEVRRLFAANPRPCYPNTTKPISERDRSYLAEAAGPLYASRLTDKIKDRVFNWSCWLGGVVSYAVLVATFASLMGKSAATVNVLFFLSVSGLGFIPGMILGLALVAPLIAYFLPKVLLQSKGSNPKLASLLERPLLNAQPPEPAKPQEMQAQSEQAPGSPKQPPRTPVNPVKNAAAYLLIPPPSRMPATSSESAAPSLRFHLD